METSGATCPVAQGDQEGPSPVVYDVASLPGFRFHPTEEELVGFNLRSMVVGSPRLEVEFINVLDLYRYDPWELPAMAFMQGEREWLFFCPRDSGSTQRSKTQPRDGLGVLEGHGHGPTGAPRARRQSHWAQEAARVLHRESTQGQKDGVDHERVPPAPERAASPQPQGSEGSGLVSNLQEDSTKLLHRNDRV